MINLQTVLTDLTGRPLKRSFPRDDADKEKEETVANVLLNALSIYPIKDRKDMFVTQHIAGIILKAGAVDTNENLFTEDEKKIIADALFHVTFRQVGEGKFEGIYQSHTIAQIYKHLNIKE